MEIHTYLFYLHHMDFFSAVLQISHCYLLIWDADCRPPIDRLGMYHSLQSTFMSIISPNLQNNPQRYYSYFIDKGNVTSVTWSSNWLRLKSRSSDSKSRILFVKPHVPSGSVLHTQFQHFFSSFYLVSSLWDKYLQSFLSALVFQSLVWFIFKKLEAMLNITVYYEPDPLTENQQVLFLFS